MWLQPSVWERIRRQKVLLRRVCSAVRKGRRGAKAYCVVTRTASLYTKFQAGRSICPKVIRGPKISKLGHVIPVMAT